MEEFKAERRRRYSKCIQTPHTPLSRAEEETIKRARTGDVEIDGLWPRALEDDVPSDDCEREVTIEDVESELETQEFIRRKGYDYEDLFELKLKKSSKGIKKNVFPNCPFCVEQGLTGLPSSGDETHATHFRVNHPSLYNLWCNNISDQFMMEESKEDATLDCDIGGATTNGRIKSIPPPPPPPVPPAPKPFCIPSSSSPIPSFISPSYLKNQLRPTVLVCPAGGCECCTKGCHHHTNYNNYDNNNGTNKDTVLHRTSIVSISAEELGKNNIETLSTPNILKPEVTRDATSPNNDEMLGHDKFLQERKPISGIIPIDLVERPMLVVGMKDARHCYINLLKTIDISQNYHFTDLGDALSSLSKAENKSNLSVNDAEGGGVGAIVSSSKRVLSSSSSSSVVQHDRKKITKVDKESQVQMGRITVTDYLPHTSNSSLEERLRENIKLQLTLPNITQHMKLVIDHATLPKKNPDNPGKMNKNAATSSGDLETLAPYKWLNDNVIDFYMKLIVERGRKSVNLPNVYAFSTFFYPKLVKKGYSSSLKRWTRKVDIFDNDLLFFPLHLGVHWCLVCADLRVKTLRYYDSLFAGGDDLQRLKKLLDYLARESKERKGQILNKKEWILESMKDIPQQRNGSDCGMFTCKYAEYLARDAKLTFLQKYMDYYRNRMVYEIVTGDLLFP